MRKTSAIVLLSTAVISLLFLPVWTFGFELQVGTVSEGYVFSKDSSFSSDERDFMENDVLHVWVWTSKLDQSKIDDHYCRLTLDGYVHEFYLNPPVQNLSQPNSFTGSFDLSRLEKVGDWSVQIYLRTNPPKPQSFEASDVIHVSALPPTTYELSVSSSPVSGVSFNLNGTNRTTFFSGVLEQASYTLVMPQSVTVDGKTYNFVEWENRLANPTRTVELSDNKSVTAYFVAAPVENLTSTVTGIVTDNRGNPITDAKVTIVETGAFNFTVLEPAGQYTFENLSEGTYTLKVEADGYNVTLRSIVVEPDKMYTQNFSLTPSTTTEPEEDDSSEVWQIGLAILAVIGAAALLLLWRSRKRFMKKIKKTEYKKSLEDLRIKAVLDELDTLLQKGLLNNDEYEKLRRQTEE